MAQSTQYGSFIENNFIWDVQQLMSVDVNSPEFKELLVRMYQNLGKMATVLNTKDTGFYEVTEVVNSQRYFSNPAYNSSTGIQPTPRQVYRKVIYYPVGLPNAGVANIPHGIVCTANTTFTRIYGVGNDVTGLNYIPLPFASPTLNNNISVAVDATNIVVTTGINRSGYTVNYFILEYLQN